MTRLWWKIGGITAVVLGVIGIVLPVLPTTPLSASTAINPYTTARLATPASCTGVWSCPRCTDEAMKNSIGTENRVLVRDARPALPNAAAAPGNERRNDC